MPPPQPPPNSTEQASSKLLHRLSNRCIAKVKHLVAIVHPQPHPPPAPATTSSALPDSPPPSPLPYPVPFAWTGPDPDYQFPPRPFTTPPRQTRRRSYSFNLFPTPSPRSPLERPAAGWPLGEGVAPPIPASSTSLPNSPRPYHPWEELPWVLGPGYLEARPLPPTPECAASSSSNSSSDHDDHTPGAGGTIISLSPKPNYSTTAHFSPHHALYREMTPQPTHQNYIHHHHRSKPSELFLSTRSRRGASLREFDFELGKSMGGGENELAEREEDNEVESEILDASGGSHGKGEVREADLGSQGDVVENESLPQLDTGEPEVGECLDLHCPLPDTSRSPVRRRTIRRKAPPPLSVDLYASKPLPPLPIAMSPIFDLTPPRTPTNIHSVDSQPYPIPASAAVSLPMSSFTTPDSPTVQTRLGFESSPTTTNHSHKSNFLHHLDSNFHIRFRSQRSDPEFSGRDNPPPRRRSMGSSASESSLNGSFRGGRRKDCKGMSKENGERRRGSSRRRKPTDATEFGKAARERWSWGTFGTKA
ncbi:hypothetical protein T439DRAFT_356554 [Meredithblackwellia eburnea MCA 4105]